MFFDFETFPSAVDTEKLVCSNHSKTNVHCKCSLSKNVDRLIPLSYSLIIINRVDKHIVEKVNYIKNTNYDEEVADHFCETLKFLRYKYGYKIYKLSESLINMTSGQVLMHKNAIKCQNCYKLFSNYPSDLKVKQRNHYSNGLNYIKPICNSCNLNINALRMSIPAFAHNFQGFDSNLIIASIVKYFGDEVNVLAKNSENLMSIKVSPFHFKDSKSFLNSSLSNLVELMKDGKSIAQLIESFSYVTEMCTDSKNILNEYKFNLLLKKNCFPYEYLDNSSKFNSSSFPEHKHFYSSLKEENVSLADYNIGKEVFKTFKCRNMWDYLKIYNYLDVILLATVFLNFSETISQKLNIYPEHFISLPGFAFEAAKRTIMINESNSCLIETIPPNMKNLYFETLNNIRGGTVFNNQRFSVSSDFADILYELAEQDEKDKLDELHKLNESVEENIFYFDQTNLYGHSLSQALPYGNYKMVSDELINQINNNLDDESKLEYIIPEYHPSNAKSHTGYFFNIEILSIPEYLSQFPPVSDHYKPSPDELSDLSKNIFSSHHPNVKMIIGSKLISNMHPKSNYLTHYSNLKYILTLGVKCTVNYGYQFSQLPIFKQYIKMCQEMRKNCKSAIEKKLWKDLANIIFGKTIENILKYTDVKYVSSASKLKTLMTGLGRGSKGVCDIGTFKIINKNLVQVSCKRKNIKAVNPVPIGFTVLELSKLLMIKTFWSHIQPHFKDNCEIIYSDTDSLIMKLKSNSLTEDLKSLRHIFDFSNLDVTDQIRQTFSASELETNRGVVGKLKSDTKSNRIHCFCGLSKKCYSFISAPHNDKRSKIFKSSITSKRLRKNKLTFKTFIKILADRDYNTMDGYRLTKKSHSVFRTREIIKGLSLFDTNIFLKNCGICCLPFSPTNFNHFKCTDNSCVINRIYLNILRSKMNKLTYV